IEASNFETVKFEYSDGAKVYDVIVESPRQNAVTLSQFMTEMLLALDLEDRMVGTALLDNPVLPEFKEAYDKIPELEIGEGHSISKEAFVATGADFVSGWDMSISDQTTGTPDELISKDITPFMAKSYDSDATVETVYEDFELLGKIFGVEDKASEVIDKMKNDIKNVTDKVGDIKEEDRVRMMVYDSGENDAMVVGSGLANNLIDLSGGNNVFAKDANKPYLNVSWESVVAQNPEVILVTDYIAGQPIEEKINFLKNHPALKDVEAIKNDRIYVIGLADLSPGVRNPKLIEKMYGYFFEESK
ncbi:MAG: ABC transporter substrate-binding protein, partial [Paraclostridium sp.]